MTQGQGTGTEFKMRGLQAACSVSLEISRKPHLMQFPYWRIDLHCGSGFNEEARCIGSPKAFLAAVKEKPRPFKAFFVDKEQARVEALERRLITEHAEAAAHCHTFVGDNAGLLPVIGELIRSTENPAYAMGDILCDPNGWFKDIPVAQMIEFCREFPRIDLHLNLNVRLYHLQRPHLATGKGKWADAVCPSLRDLPQLFGKKHWLIRNVIRSNGHGFVLLIGRNYPVREHKALGFHHMEGEIGQRIVSAIEQERPASARADLFQALPDVSGVSGACSLQGGARSGDAQGQLDL